MVAKKRSAPKKATARRSPRQPAAVSGPLVPGNDEVDLGDGVGVTLRDGIAGFRPVAFGRMSPALQELAGEMILNIGTQRRLSTEFDSMVDHARRHGMSWGSIGWCAGMTAQGAQNRWGRA
jgi:hypothetical protein